MGDGSVDLAREARARAYAMPLEEINVADDELFRTESLRPGPAKVHEKSKPAAAYG